jgi:ElaB/YqjD/DUF883 family membrane-anchored ribosome-binding protein
MSLRDPKAVDPLAEFGELPESWGPVLKANTRYHDLIAEQEAKETRLEELRAVKDDLARPLGLDVQDPMEKARELNEEIISTHQRLHELRDEIAAADTARLEALRKHGGKFSAEEEQKLRTELVPALLKATDELEARLDAVNASHRRLRLLNGDDPKTIRPYLSVNVAIDQKDAFGQPIAPQHASIGKFIRGLRDLAERIENDLKPKSPTFLAEAEDLAPVGSRRVRPNVPLSMGGQK